MNKVRMILNGLLFILAVTALAACASSSTPSTDVPILQKLSNIEGEFIWNERLKRYVYSEMELIENALAPIARNELIAILVNCIDNPSSSNSTLNGKHTPLGVVCYQALSQTAYYEATDSTGDIKSRWSGHVLPTANANELREAKRAWLEVINSNSYILY